MAKTTDIRVEPADAFFERGRGMAKLADLGKPVPESRVLAFEDVRDLLGVLTAKRISLLRAVQDSPGSITALSARLKRDRSAVTRDVQLLERYGILEAGEKVLPGHGRQKWVVPVARRIQLTAQI